MVRETKINQILQKVQPGAVLLSDWLVRNGYSLSLQQEYRRSGWLKSIGKNAMMRSGQVLTVAGALHALQWQAGLSIHVGARSALAMLGYAQYVEMAGKSIYLFTNRETHIPAWFKNNAWDREPVVVTTDFLPADSGLTEVEMNGIRIKSAGAARAIMECLELAPNGFDLTEAWEIMQGLTTLQPKVVEQLLVECKSVKVKRLFLYMAERAGHAWMDKLELYKIDLGKGKRSIVNNGVYVSKYQMTVPANLTYGL